MWVLKHPTGRGDDILFIDARSFGHMQSRVRRALSERAGYLVHYLALPAVRDWVDRHATGTAVPTISVQAYRALPVVLPPLAVQDAIGEVLGLLDEKVDIHERISQSTARLRDTFAPLLITGAIPAWP